MLAVVVAVVVGIIRLSLSIYICSWDEKGNVDEKSACASLEQWQRLHQSILSFCCQDLGLGKQ